MDISSVSASSLNNLDVAGLAAAVNTGDISQAGDTLEGLFGEEEYAEMIEMMEANEDMSDGWGDVAA